MAKRNVTQETDEPETKILVDYGIHLLSNEFDYDTANEVITWILESNLHKNNCFDHLTLIINSSGGDLACAFAIIDVMQGSSLPIHTIGLGEIASCALMTFLAGAPGHRLLTPNTSVMSHQWTGGAIGKAHELISAQKEQSMTTQKVLNHYMKFTGLSAEIVMEKLLPAHDVFLTAEEAFELNICDLITQFKQPKSLS